MTGQDLTLFQAMYKKLDWQDARQKTIAQNIANADTPGYKPQDLDPLNFDDLLKSSTSKVALGGSGGMTVTNPMHISSGASSGSGCNVVAKNEKKPYETSPSGNAVILEEQLLKMNQNAADHQLVLNMYKKELSLLKESEK